MLCSLRLDWKEEMTRDIFFRVEDLVVLGGKTTLKKDLSVLRDSLVERATASASDRLLLEERHATWHLLR